MNIGIDNIDIVLDGYDIDINNVDNDNIYCTYQYCLLVLSSGGGITASMMAVAMLHPNSPVGIIKHLKRNRDSTLYVI